MPITPQEALRIILSHVRPLPARRVGLAGALHACLAEEIWSDRDQPPADRSAMDGYAVRSKDLPRVPGRLRPAGEAPAGGAVAVRLRPGTCIAILTGANVPPGADAVAPVENTSAAAGEVVFHAPVRRGDHIRKRGEEARRGRRLLSKGTLLGPFEIGLCAMVGRATVAVHGRPRVGVLCTGAELRDPSERVGTHEVRDSNGPALLAALAACGLKGPPRRIAPDCRAAIAAQLRRRLRACEVVVITGGVSVGRYDFVPEAVRLAGGTIRFHGVSMKPGRPNLYATAAAGRHIFGLPGNPVSALTGFGELVLPAVRRLSGLPAEACRGRLMLPLARPARPLADRTFYHLARILHRAEGTAILPLPSRGSADLIAACAADGVILLPPGLSPLPAGAMVEFHAWRVLA